MKKRIIIFLVFLISGLIINYSVENNSFKHITTDSGFDSSYSGETYSGSDKWESGDSHYDYDYDYDRSNRNGRGLTPPDSDVVMLFAGIFIVGFVVLIVTRLLSKDKKSNRYNNTIQGLPKTIEVQKVLDEAYNIFIDVQKAWMNFDYDKMRELVTDELYNMYYNQLQTLSIKGEKNVMSNFQLINIELLSEKEENNKKYYKVDLTVSFYDYIVDSNDKIVRGNDNSLIIMHYILDYVKSNNEVDRCLKCGAKIENGITTCPYCHSHIQGVSSKMKLSSKRVITQR